jgi:hypothetical protein
MRRHGGAARGPPPPPCRREEAVAAHPAAFHVGEEAVEALGPRPSACVGPWVRARLGGGGEAH